MLQNQILEESPILPPAIYIHNFTFRAMCWFYGIHIDLSSLYVHLQRLDKVFFLYLPSWVLCGHALVELLHLIHYVLFCVPLGLLLLVTVWVCTVHDIVEFDE